MNYSDFKEIIDNLHDEIMVYDGDYTLVYVNQAALRHYGVPAEDLIGRRFDELADTYWGNSTLPEVYRTGEMVARRQITNKGQDIVTISVPIFDEEGKIKYVAQNVNDLYQLNEMNLVELKPVEVAQNMGGGFSVEPFFGQNKIMAKNLEMIEQLKNIDSPCFIQGETGTGKNVLVKYIHRNSNRADKPLVTLNCACINKNIIESELFGYKKGAFSGASSQGKKGLVEVAEGGILFLDEISEIPYDLQAKLLYFIQDKKFIPVGGEKEQEVDVRIVAASNRNLKQMVESGTFRADLYFRLNTFEIQIPALRERMEDLNGFIDYYLQIFNEKYHKDHIVSYEARQMMKKYSWPGNLRELSNIMEKLVVLSRQKEIQAKDLPNSIFDLMHGEPSPHSFSLQQKTSSQESKRDSGEEVDEFLTQTLADAMEAVEKKMIQRAYEQHRNSIQVAKALGISQSKAYRLMVKYIPGYKKP